MKLFLIIAFFFMTTLFSFVASAQHKDFSFGIQAGFNLSKASVHTDYFLGEPQYKPGFQAGVTTDYRFNRYFFLQSGLALTTKGVKRKGAELWVGGSSAPVTYYTTATNQIYLQLPLKIAYRAHVNRQTSLFVNAGPYIAYGIGGKETMKETTKPATARHDEKFVVNTFDKAQRRRGDYGLNRLDYGASFGLGAIYKKYILSGGYEIGLPDIGEPYGAPGSILPAYEYKNRNLFITIGYQL